jgi:protein SCO1/2
MKTHFIFLLMFLLGFACSEPQTTEKAGCCSKAPVSPGQQAEVLPGNSLYHLESRFTDPTGKPFMLQQLAGKTVVMTMFFSHCEYACPMMIHDLKKIEEQFGPKDRDRFQFVLVSFDHKRDTAERLMSYALSQGMAGNWLLLHGGTDAVKDISVVLDIVYEPLENGSFAHSNKKVILDKTGTVVFTEEGLQRAPDAVVQVLKKLI